MSEIIPEMDVFLFKAIMSGMEGASAADKNRRVSETARNFVKMYISQRTGLKNDTLQFSTGPYGKPYIENCGVQFNISHCGNIVLVAFSEEEIGADVEAVNRTGTAIVERMFARGERDYIGLARTQPEAQRRFCEIWTAKEAFGKLLGAGLAVGTDFATADGSGMLDTVVSEKFGSAKLYHKQVSLRLIEDDFIPRRTEFTSQEGATFQICICARQLGKVNFQLFE